MTELCACGEPLHYTHPASRAEVEALIQSLGPNLRVTVGERTWLVPRHYIALHGIKAWELSKLGFEEING